MDSRIEGEDGPPSVADSPFMNDQHVGEVDYAVKSRFFTNLKLIQVD